MKVYKIDWMLMGELAYFSHNVSLNACQKIVRRGVNKKVSLFNYYINNKV